MATFAKIVPNGHLGYEHALPRTGCERGMHRISLLRSAWLGKGASLSPPLEGMVGGNGLEPLTLSV